MHLATIVAEERYAILIYEFMMYGGGGGVLPKTVLVRTLMPQSHARIPLLTPYIAMIGVQRTA